MTVSIRRVYERERELLLRPRPSYDDYMAAAAFIAHMHKNRRFITKTMYADLRKRALEGDIMGASIALNRAIEDRKYGLKERKV